MGRYIGSQGVNGVANGRPYKQQFVCPSESSDNEYVVTQYADGPFDSKQPYPQADLNAAGQPEFACGCIGWTRHFPRQDCKHIKYARAGGAKTFDEAIANKLLGKTL